MLIVWLSWFGVRKRRYRSRLGSVEGWLSAHVYLGSALLVVALLHTGFQFGINVHTLAFVLMTIVIASGLCGVWIYMTYPAKLSANRGGSSREDLFAQLDDIDRRSRRVAANLPGEFLELVTSGINRTQLGATLWQRLRAYDGSRISLPKGGEMTLNENRSQEAALDWIAEQQSRTSDSTMLATIGELSALLRNKRRLQKTLRQELRLQAILEIWLYVHVPMTAALLVALLIHIVSVFLYW